MIDRIRIAIREAINRRRDHLDTEAPPVRTATVRDPARADRAAAAKRTLAERQHEHQYPLTTGVCDCGDEHPLLGPVRD